MSRPIDTSVHSEYCLCDGDFDVCCDNEANYEVDSYEFDMMIDDLNDWLEDIEPVS